MLEEIKNTYEKILDLNLQINSSLNNFPKKDFDSFNEKLQELIDLKTALIQNLLSLKANSEEKFKKINAVELKEISQQINNLEQENLKLIQDKKNYLSEEMKRTYTSGKALSAYKINKQTKPKFFDKKD